ncbi:MAG: ORF6N domain-containing protein [Planctomycetota bacterium]
MNLTLSNEKVLVNGKSIPKIYGGFGNNQPSILAKQVAEIHDYEVKRINELVNNNLDWFDEGTDL